MCLHRTGIKKNIPLTYSEICVKVFRKHGKSIKSPSFGSMSGAFRKVVNPTYTDLNCEDILAGSIGGDLIKYTAGYHAFRYGTKITSYDVADDPTLEVRLVVLSDITAIGYQEFERGEQVVVGRTMYIVPKKDEAVFKRLAQNQKKIPSGVYTR